MECKTLGIRQNPLFEDGTGPGLEPVDDEFQPQLETGYPGGDAHLILRLNPVARYDTKVHREPLKKSVLTT